MSFPQAVAETQHNQISGKQDFDSAINHGAAAAERKPLSQHLFRNRTSLAVLLCTIDSALQTPVFVENYDDTDSAI